MVAFAFVAARNQDIVRLRCVFSPTAPSLDQARGVGCEHKTVQLSNLSQLGSKSLSILQCAAAERERENRSTQLARSHASNTKTRWSMCGKKLGHSQKAAPAKNVGDCGISGEDRCKCTDRRTFWTRAIRLHRGGEKCRTRVLSSNE